MSVISVMATNQGTGYGDLVEQYGSPLMVLDCDKVRRRYRELNAALPGVSLFFAIKSLPERAMLSTLAAEGACFDVATSGEIQLLKSIGANPQATIHTHPIKKDQDIRDALHFGTTTFVVDNLDELQKFIPYSHQVELLLRVSFRSKDAAVDLSRKFGCSLNDVPFLLTEAAKLEIVVKGLSFHVGSQSLSSDGHVDAIRSCRAFFADTTLVGTERLQVLDIGGGFPVDYLRVGFDLDAFCRPIVAALAEYPAHVEFYAEPGRVLSAPAMISISTVVGRAERAGLHWYYLDDGVYGAYSGVIFDHAPYPISVCTDGKGSLPSVLAGPTCDSIDVITELAMLPELSIGDIVIGELMGAYTLATACEFNSIPKPTLVTLNARLVDSHNVHSLVVNA